LLIPIVPIVEFCISQTTFFVELMNSNITMLIIKDIRSQQNLNTPKEKLRIKPNVKHRPTFDFSFGECFVEKPLRKYSSVYKDIKPYNHQINVFSLTLKP